MQHFAIEGCPAKWSILGVPFLLALAKVAPSRGSKFHRAREMRRRCKKRENTEFLARLDNYCRASETEHSCELSRDSLFRPRDKKSGAVRHELRTYLRECKHGARDFDVARLTICGLKHEKAIVRRDRANFTGLFTRIPLWKLAAFEMVKQRSWNS